MFGFSIDATSGQISITEALERDGVNGVETQTILVEAFQLTNSQRRASVAVVVHVQDVDDNPPVMSQSLYEASVPENSPPGTFVLSLLAIDLDMVRPEYLICTLLTPPLFRRPSNNDVRNARCAPFSTQEIFGMLGLRRKESSVCLVSNAQKCLFSGSFGQFAATESL